MTIKLAKQALLALEPEQLSAIGHGYSGCWINSDYGKVNQRWLLVHSEQATKREEITFFKNLEANIAKEIKALEKLSKNHSLVKLTQNSRLTISRNNVTY